LSTSSDCFGRERAHQIADSRIEISDRVGARVQDEGNIVETRQCWQLIDAISAIGGGKRGVNQIVGLSD
jgi:hypothetical protein